MKWPVLAHGAWNRWWGPSLTRRTLLALLAAMGLVWLVLLAQMAYTHYETMGTNPGVRQLAQGLAVPLASMPDPVEARALAMAQQLCALPAVALRLIKESVLMAMETPLSAGLEFERNAFQTAFASPDKHEGMRARLDKRPARFNQG